MQSQEDENQFPADCLPPEGEYGSRDEVYKALNAWAAPRGYAFVTGRSHKEISGRVSVTYTCDRACRPPNASESRKRQTSTRGTGCQFSVLAKQSYDKTTWAVKHRPDSRFAIHNHQPSWHQSAHPVHRVLSTTEKATIGNLANAGVAPKDIRTHMRQHSSIIATQQDIYNRIAESKRELCEGQSTMQAFANQLDEQGFWNRMKLDNNGRLTAVLFAHPESLMYLKAYPDLLFLDCTYKTNKYGMPLLDIIGVDACQRSFCIAFAFLSGESEEDYIWALERLRSMYELCGAKLPSVVLTDRCLACMNAVSRCFPAASSLLCLWHANKAVLQYCKPGFTKDLQGETERQQAHQDWSEFYNYWHSLMRSIDENTFNERLKDFEQRYVPEHVREVSYVKETWLDLYKEKLVKSWVDQHPHFGSVVTSRVEGIHALLKSHLKKSTLDLFEAWRAIKQALANQLAELRSNQAKQHLRMPIELSGSMYSIVRGWISHQALRKVEEQRKRSLQKDMPPCTGIFSRSHGLPCAHKLKELEEQDQTLGLEHFHKQWHLCRRGSPQLLREPRRQFDRVAAQSSQPQSSTRRELSGFEIIESRDRPKAQPTCSRCHNVGHRMTSKACPLRYAELCHSLVPTTDGTTQTASMSTAVVAAPAAMEAESTQTVSGPKEACESAGAETQSKAADLEQIDEIIGAEELVEYTSVSQTATPQPTERATDCIIVNAAVEQQPEAPKLRYDDPEAIYQRYIKAREAWYNGQPRGSIKTNQQYRKAKGLPQRYDKADIAWCLDWKQMGKQCRTQKGCRDWTKEEMMAYLDWDRAEEDRVEAMVATEMEGNQFSKRRGMGEIWEAAAADSEAQAALYSAR
jgi:hypothetical protein